MEVLDCVSNELTFRLFANQTMITVQEADIRRIQVAIAKGSLRKEDVYAYQVINGTNERLTFTDDGSIEEDVPALSVIPDCKIELMRIKKRRS